MTRDERNGERETERDEDLQRLLARWSASPVPDGMDGRVLAAYRRETGGAEPWWKRLLTASVRVPLPVAVGVLLLLIVTAVLARRPAPPAPTAGTAAPSEPVQAVRHPEVPVVTPTSLAGFQPVAEVTATVVTNATETRR
ncbi:MAG: hypothetical protein ACHP85_03975 [Burkholderiales bacterium]|jgi:hypothetical protein